METAHPLPYIPNRYLLSGIKSHTYKQVPSTIFKIAWGLEVNSSLNTTYEVCPIIDYIGSGSETGLNFFHSFPFSLSF